MTTIAASLLPLAKGERAGGDRRSGYLYRGGASCSTGDGLWRAPVVVLRDGGGGVRAHVEFQHRIGDDVRHAEGGEAGADAANENAFGIRAGDDEAGDEHSIIGIDETARRDVHELFGLELHAGRGIVDLHERDAIAVGGDLRGIGTRRERDQDRSVPTARIQAKRPDAIEGRNHFAVGHPAFVFGNEAARAVA